VKDLIAEIVQALPRVLLMPKPLMNLESQQCPHCEVNLRVPEIPLIRISSRFDEATTLAWECPFCHEADVIPGMEAKWAEFVKHYEEIWEQCNASKDHEREVYARGPESVDLGWDGYDRSVLPYPVKRDDWEVCNPGIPMPGTPEESGDLPF
jgi:hypothetical protein